MEKEMNCKTEILYEDEDGNMHTTITYADINEENIQLFLDSIAEKLNPIKLTKEYKKESE